MHPIVIYLLKCMACSALLFGYYRIAFYNRVNHQWNRLFLLATVLFSLCLPLIKIYVPLDIASAQPGMVKLLNVVVTDKVETDDFMLSTVQSINFTYFFGVSYVGISIVFLLLFVRSLMTIRKIYYSSS